MGKKSIAAFLLLAAVVRRGAINLSLAQIDASRLLLAQEVDLYVGVTGEDGQAPARPAGRRPSGSTSRRTARISARCRA